MKVNRTGQAEPLKKENLRALEAILTQPHRLILQFCWYTAERPSAILQLHQESVWSDKGRLRNEILFTAKSRKDRKPRLCPVHPKLRKAIEQYRRPDSTFVFPSPRDDDRPLCWSTYQKALYSAFDVLGMEGYTTYSARRGALTHLRRKGIHLRQIQAISGHRSLASLQQYLEVDPEEIKAGIELL